MRKPSALELAGARPDLRAAVLRSQHLLRKRALLAAGLSAVPLPGLGWVADAALLSKLISRINSEFGLDPTQVAALSTSQRALVQQTANSLGSALIGKLITQDLLLHLAKTVGLRLSAKQAARYVPIAGQIVSATLGYAIVRVLGERHIRDCVRIVLAAKLRLPAPTNSPKHGHRGLVAA